MTAGAKRVELSIPASADYIVVARLTTAAVASRLGFGIEHIEDLKLAVAEACTACIFDGQPANTIAIVWEVVGDMLEVRVADQGGEHEGLGITIIRQLMDSVSYLSEGSVVTLLMSKRLETP